MRVGEEGHGDLWLESGNRASHPYSSGVVYIDALRPAPPRRLDLNGPGLRRGVAT